MATQVTPFTVPALTYAFNALEPYIDAKTMEIHHDKHHAAYVTNLNKALEGHDDLQKLSLEELLANECAKVPAAIRTAVRNNGGGHHNHSLFWKWLSPSGGGQPQGEIAGLVKEAFSGFEGFKTQFTQTATARFGSGWAWLVLNQEASS